MNQTNSPSKQSGAGPWVGALVGPVFLALAAWFVWGPELADMPDSKAAALKPGQIGTEPLRQIMGDEPTAFIGGFDQKCIDCHRFFQSTPTTNRRLTQHTNIVLNHGLNNRCLNCHDDTDRSKLVLHDGTKIPFTQVEHLCAKCHGPTYRDWQKGMHGKTLGYWNAKLGPQRRLKCTHCHNPHSPAFEPMAPLPGPHTLRMGQPHHGSPGEEEKSLNPLRVWSQAYEPTDMPEKMQGSTNHD